MGLKFSSVGIQECLILSQVNASHSLTDITLQANLEYNGSYKRQMRISYALPIVNRLRGSLKLSLEPGISRQYIDKSSSFNINVRPNYMELKGMFYSGG